MSKEIQQIAFKEHIRKRPGMYLGGVGSKGIILLLKGLVSNCIEVSATDHYFFQIELVPDDEYRLIIEASDDIASFKKTINNSDDFENFHLKVCEALSSSFKLTTEDNNKLILNFKLDKTIFKEAVDYPELYESFLQWTTLNRNSEVLLIDKRERFLSQNYFSFPKGVKYLYDRMVKEALGKPEFEIFFDGELGGLKYQIFLGYRTDWYPSSTIVSFANDAHTVCGGSLVEGITSGLIAGCRKYVKDNNLTDFKIRKKKFNNGLILVASVRGSELTYGGSFKETLEDDKVRKDAKKLMKQLTTDFILNDKEKADKFLWRFDEKQLTSGIY
ncbi:MAG: hypothetical protein ACFB0B_03670 [Thermonemataceae bacterium]